MTDRINGYMSTVDEFVWSEPDTGQESNGCKFPGCGGNPGYNETYCSGCQKKTIPKLLEHTGNNDRIQ